MTKINSNERLINEVRQDYLKRREARRSLEAQWQLNINFYMGNQYSCVRPNNNVTDSDKQYFWQEREVFNHVTPTIETRLSKIVQLIPEIKVLPATTDDSDVHSAKLCKNIFDSVKNKLDLNKIMKTATTWSEICGTVFYKVVWNSNLGMVFASTEKDKAIKLGDVDIAVCSPFEIFPDNLYTENIDNCKSIIHAKTMDVKTIKSIYNVSVMPEKCYSFSVDNTFGSVGGLGYDGAISKIANTEIDNSCMVIERYVRPNVDMPNGRLTIIAGDKLLFDGELPYKIGENNVRDFPLIKQVSCSTPGFFFGTSIIERLIPIQRAYNAVRNRKHEYFNRLSMGVLTVESGSVDTDALEEDGLSPGKVLVYRQGCKAPEIMNTPNINTNFEAEEERLLNEFKTISGVSELMKQSFSKYTNLSGTALQLLLEEDEARLQPSVEDIKSCLIVMAKYILRLYKQYAVVPRVLKIAGETGDVKLYYWDQNEITSDDVIFDTNRSIGESIATKRTMLLDLINTGLMYDEDGKFSQNMRKKCLDMLGFGIWENSTDLHSLHINKAQEENIEIEHLMITPLNIDEHETHINEHIAYLLGNEIKKKDNKASIQTRLIDHIKLHKQMQKDNQ